MSSPLHITNGDSFTGKLKTLKLDGDIITWREMLCEGKTLTNVGSESFWKTRFEFLNKTYKVSKSSFIEKTLKEYRSLCNHKKQDKIVLWFEHDLFCQVNLLAVISWLKMHRKYAEISLVCSGKEDDSDKLYGLSELNEEQLRNLYENRITLSRDDIEYADYIWQLYCSDNPIRLENVKDFGNYQFNYLNDAIKSHLKRFPSISNGLNEIENNILKIALEQKPTSRDGLLGTILRSQDVHGFGDTQYNKVISNLKPLFTSFDPVKLTKKGKEILERKANYYATMRNNEIYLGGALKYNYLYNTESNRILKL
ncbi:MAG: DUF1835 domain-containing protein [Cellulophaga sp.]